MAFSERSNYLGFGMHVGGDNHGQTFDISTGDGQEGDESRPNPDHVQSPFFSHQSISEQYKLFLFWIASPFIVSNWFDLKVLLSNLWKIIAMLVLGVIGFRYAMKKLF